MATPERYYDAALICITLVCERCQASLDPDKDLDPGVGFHTDGWYILLADEAYRLGWQIEIGASEVGFTATCPACAMTSD
jgi:hypothetical protein